MRGDEHFHACLHLLIIFVLTVDKRGLNDEAEGDNALVV